MARRVILWGAGAVAVGLALTGYLGFVQRHAFALRGGGVAAGSQAAAREGRLNYLAGREAIHLQVARYRLLVEDLLEARRDDDSNSIVVAFDAGAGIAGPAAETIRRTLAEEWHDLGLGATKVAVGVVVIDRATARTIGRGLAIGAEDPSAFYVLPDSLAPATCLVLVVAPTRGSEGRLSTSRSLQEMARLWYGPCAFYARFGIPGPRVAKWLEARGLDLALAPAWVATPGDTALLMPALSPSGPNRKWYWDMIYWMPPRAVECLSGSAEACHAALVEGDVGRTDPPDWIVVQSANSWRFTRQRVTGGDHFLAAVLRAAGPRRFQEFWRTSLPVDSALTRVLRTPVGEWTAAWQREVAEPPRPGPMPRLGDLLVCAALGALALGATMRNARRRSAA